MFKIAFIYSAYPDIAEAAEEIIKRTGWHIEFATAVFDRAVKLAKEYEKKGFDLIISRGVSGSLIKQALNIPVILIEISTFDILYSIYEARQHGSKIGFFQFKDYRGWDFDSIKQILGIDKLHIYYYQSELELKDQIERAVTDDIDVIVATGSYVRELIRPYGKNTVTVLSTKESIYTAFKQAEDILHIRNQDQMFLQYQSALLSGAFVGYILLNANNEILHADEGAYSLLKLEQPHNNKPSFPPRFINDVVDSEIVEINGRSLLVRSKKLPDQNNGICRAVYLSYPEQQELVSYKRQKEINDGQAAKYGFSDIVGKSRAIIAAINDAQAYAKYDANILISGESGTGKEVFAHSIHSSSARKRGPFVAINCATLPHSLLESELFGYEEGAFTGAKRGGSRGIFEIADRGTIFLDEISQILLSDQAQLLRVLQEKRIRRIGGKKTIPVDVRVIAATNVDLMQKVNSGQFRLDLYYRLNILNLHLPPLRERKDDIPLLIDHFMKKQDLYFTIPELLMAKFISYSWPGNIRELANIVEKFAILSQNDENVFRIIEDLYSEFGVLSETDSPGSNSITIRTGTLKRMELEIIKQLYEKHGKDRMKLASMLGIGRTNLWMKLNEIYKKGTK
jgi:transcriptional regulator with PAS, ATPase and Fis domain